MRKRVLLIGIPLLVVSLGLGAYVAQQSWQAREDRGATKPLADLAATFPVPPGSVIAFPTTVDATPPTVVMGWKNPETSIGDACSYWRDAFRTWVSNAEPDSVQGNTVEGQSCTLGTRKNDSPVTLIVAVYGSEPPQATLTVTE